MDGITELAKLLKERNPKSPPSITTGIVIEPPPNPRIRLNDIIILGKENLVFSAHLLKGYERKLRFKETDWGITTTNSDHNHHVNLKEEDTLVEWTDTIKTGDEVILIPSMDEQTYFVIDKAVRY